MEDGKRAREKCRASETERDRIQQRFVTLSTNNDEIIALKDEYKAEAAKLRAKVKALEAREKTATGERETKENQLAVQRDKAMAELTAQLERLREEYDVLSAQCEKQAKDSSTHSEKSKRDIAWWVPCHTCGLSLSRAPFASVPLISHRDVSWDGWLPISLTSQLAEAKTVAASAQAAASLCEKDKLEVSVDQHHRIKPPRFLVQTLQLRPPTPRAVPSSVGSPILRLLTCVFQAVAKLKEELVQMTSLASSREKLNEVCSFLQGRVA